MTTREPDRADLLAAIAAAIRAPSLHNTQPWLFRVTGTGIEVHADPTRQLALADPDGRALRVSCGAAIYNLRLALQRLGYVPSVQLVGTAGLLAVVQTAGRRVPTPMEIELYDAIARRHSNRYPFEETPVSLDVRASLLDAARAEECWLDLILGPAGLETVAQLVRVADRILTADPAYLAEVAAWTRSIGGSDGVSQRAGGPLPEPQELLARRDYGGPPLGSARDFEREPLVGVLGARTESPWDDLVAGQALQRVLLTATSLGLATSLMSQPIEVARVREQLRLGLRRAGAPHMLLRFGYALPAPATPRRPLADVLLPEVSPVGAFGPSRSGYGGTARAGG
jgi:nitroreductase